MDAFFGPLSIPKYIGTVSIERETFPLLLERGWHLFGYRTQGFFVDIGTPEGYQRFQHYVEVKPL